MYTLCVYVCVLRGVTSLLCVGYDRCGGVCGWKGRSLRSTSGVSERKTRRRRDSRPSRTNGGRGLEQNKRWAGLRAEQTMGGAQSRTNGGRGLEQYKRCGRLAYSTWWAGLKARWVGLSVIGMYTVAISISVQRACAISRITQSLQSPLFDVFVATSLRRVTKATPRSRTSSQLAAAAGAAVAAATNPNTT